MAKEVELSKKDLARIINEGIIKEGNVIKIPAEPNPGMTCRQAAKALNDKADSEEQQVNAQEIVEGNPFDALVAFHAVLKQTYGWSTVKEMTVQGFFGPQKVPPQFIDVRTGPKDDDVIQVPIGDISAPQLNFCFNVHFDQKGLYITAECRQFEARILTELAVRVRLYLKSNSIYQGKAFRMPAKWSSQPKFESFEHVAENDLILNEPVQNAVLVNLFAPVEKRQEMKDAGIPFKNVVLLSGPYGTGKSMVTSILGKKGLENGCTVIYLDDTTRLAEAMERAKERMPCILIAEDLDRVAGNRDDKLNVILNTISGVLSSDKDDILVVLTTNHAEKIENVMLRRVTMVQVAPPNVESTERLLRLYGRGRVVAGCSLEVISHKLAGQSPTTIQRVVRQADKARIAIGGKGIDEAALIASMHSMGDQIELLNSERVKEIPTLDQALTELLLAAVVKASGEAHARTYEIGGHTSHAKKIRDMTKDASFPIN